MIINNLSSGFSSSIINQNRIWIIQLFFFLNTCSLFRIVLLLDFCGFQNWVVLMYASECDEAQRSAWLWCRWLWQLMMKWNIIFVSLNLGRPASDYSNTTEKTAITTRKHTEFLTTENIGHFLGGIFRWEIGSSFTNPLEMWVDWIVQRLNEWMLMLLCTVDAIKFANFVFDLRRQGVGHVLEVRVMGLRIFHHDCTTETHQVIYFRTLAAHLWRHVNCWISVWWWLLRIPTNRGTIEMITEKERKKWNRKFTAISLIYNFSNFRLVVWMGSVCSSFGQVFVSPFALNVRTLVTVFFPIRFRAQ